MRIGAFVRSVWGIAWLALKRLRSAPELTIGLLVGLLTIVALVSSIPAYVEAANNRLLQGELAAPGSGQSGGLVFLYQYNASVSEAVRWADIQAADSYLVHGATSDIHLPVKHAGFYMHSDWLVLYPPDAKSQPASERLAVAQMQAGFVRQLLDHIVIVEGRAPQPTAAGAPIEALVSEGQANRLGLRAGEEFMLFREEVSEGGGTPSKRFQDRLRVTGIWRARDEKESFWYLAPKTFDDVFLMPESTYVERIIADDQPYGLAYAAWHLIYDGAGVGARDVPSLLGRIAVVRNELVRLLPQISFPVDPVWPLKRYQQAVNLQTRILLTFGLPLFGLALGYVAFLSALAVRQQGLEIALFKSRGASGGQIILLYLVQTLCLGLVALGLGLALGRVLAQAMVYVRSFLGFGVGRGLEVRLTTASLQLSLGVIGLAILSCLLPAFRWARLTIVTFKSNLSRLVDRSWWQHQFLDVILLAAALYGYYVLKRQGGLAFLLGGAGDPLQNPLLLLAPSLFALAAALLFLRAFPYLMRLLHWLSRLLSGPVPFLAFGRLSRSSGGNGVLLLLVLTVSLSVFTGSLAQTLDTNVIQRAYYRVGADLSLQESTAGGGAFAIGQETASPEEQAEDQVYALPAEDAQRVPGVRRATRVIPLSVTPTSGDRGMLLGVNRLTLPGVAFFRPDFARRSLGVLMNELARDPQGALVSDTYMATYGLQIGDPLRVQVNNPAKTQLEFTIVGALHLFPTFYLGQSGLALLIVANTDYLEEQLGYPLTGQLWLRVDEGVETKAIVEQAKQLGYHISASESAHDEIAREQGRLERVGLFGFLSIGFTIISFLGMLCLVIYTVLSLRQWVIQFGILRAIGLTASQLVGVVVLEQSTIVLLGLLAGAGFGIGMSYLFLPFLQVTYADRLPLPPLAIEIAWQGVWRAYAVIGVALLVAVVSMSRSLRRIQMFEAIKMGESQSL